MTDNINTVALINLEESVIAALAKYVAKSTVPMEGESMTSKDLQAELQAHVDTMNAVNDARAKYRQLVALAATQREATAPLLAGIRAFASATFGQTSPAFAAFGFKPRKIPQRTAQSKADAAAKLRATRAARHTMGKRQRSVIHGSAPAPSPTPSPVVAPPTPSPVVAPPTPSPVVAPPTSPTPIAAPTDPSSNGVTH